MDIRTRTGRDTPLEQAAFLLALLGPPAAAPRRQPAGFKLVLRLARLREPVLVEKVLGGGLTRVGRVEPHPIFSVPSVKPPDGVFLL